MRTSLDMLLATIRDGRASADEIGRARELARHDARFPPEVAEGLFDDDPSADASGLLALLGEDSQFSEMLRDAITAEAGPLSPGIGADLGDIAELDLPVGEAVRSEAGQVDVSASVLDQLGAPALPCGEAIAAEAGPAELADQVMLAAGLALSSAGQLRAAVAYEAGEPPELTSERSAAREISGWDVGDDARVALGLALREEAGAIDVVGAVMAELEPAAGRQGPALDLRAPSMPAPANSTTWWSWGGLVVAAVGLLVAGINLGLPVGGAGGLPGLPQDGGLTFASAGEVVVESLEYGDDVRVFQAEGDQGALIIWVDEEAVL